MLNSKQSHNFAEFRFQFEIQLGKAVKRLSRNLDIGTKYVKTRLSDLSAGSLAHIVMGLAFVVISVVAGVIVNEI